MDRRAWWVIVHVAARVRQLSTHTMRCIPTGDKYLLHRFFVFCVLDKARYGYLKRKDWLKIR